MGQLREDIDELVLLAKLHAAHGIASALAMAGVLLGGTFILAAGEVQRWIDSHSS